MTIFQRMERWAVERELTTRDYTVLEGLMASCYSPAQGDYSRPSELLTAWRLYERGRAPKREHTVPPTAVTLKGALKAARKPLGDWLGGKDRALDAAVGAVLVVLEQQT